MIIMVSMTIKERFLKTFMKKNVDELVFSPRIYYWYLGNKIYLKSKKNIRQHCHIPLKYFGMKQIEIYKDLRAAPRYVPETLYFPLFKETINHQAGIHIIEKYGENRSEKITIYKTPKGNLTRRMNNGHIIEYPIKSLEDMRIMKYIMENTNFVFLRNNYKKAKEVIGDLGVVSTYFPRSPYMKLIIDFMGFSRTIIFLKKHKNEMENFMSFMKIWDDKMYEVLTNSPIKIFNFGENLDSNLCPPHYFEKYLKPYYEERVAQFHSKKKFCHIHIDGSLKDLLLYLGELPFDGYEALTSKPQGDVSLIQIKRAIKDKIFLDGIPSILFLPQYSNNKVKKFLHELMELFAPYLIIGVSDEFPPNGKMDKLEQISEIIRLESSKYL